MSQVITPRQLLVVFDNIYVDICDLQRIKKIRKHALIEGLEFSEGREESCFIASKFEEFVSKAVKPFIS